MEKIFDKTFGGERPLYASHGLHIERVNILAGESAVKECSQIEAVDCRFEGKYPLWCCADTLVQGCTFTEGARAAIWYSQDMIMKDCDVIAPKMFREMDRLRIERTKFHNAEEMLWGCRGVEMHDCELEGALYPFMHCSDVKLDRVKVSGRYSFQYARNIEIRNSVLDSKDSFWETENVTIYDSTLIGEYLAWYSKNLRLVRCRIEGTQPLCYAENLVLEDCTFGEDADLAFEYSTVQATIQGRVHSVKNPTSGHIHVSGGYGEIIIDANRKAPGDCVID